jgi:hypothetical protein
MINPNEVWQVDVNGEVFETNFQGLVDWIAEGSLLRADKVKRGNLRWLEAGKIPLLFGFFNAKELGHPMPQIQFSSPEGEVVTEMAAQQGATLAATQNFAPAQSLAETHGFAPAPTDFSPAGNFTLHENLPPTENFAPPQDFYQPQFAQPLPAEGVCIIHNDVEASYICETCVNHFCKGCPKGYGGNVKICPMCGSMCTSIKQLQETHVDSIRFQNDMREGFGIADFGRAMAYPFKFKTSLFFGAFLFMLFTIGQTASGSGSFMMFGAVIICFMLANMMTFAVLANTVENFSQGKIGGNFMPSWDDFSLWDDMIHPFFLSVGVYLVSFGVTIALIVGGAWFMWKTISATVEKEKPNMFSQMEKMNDPVNGYKTPNSNTNAEPVWMSDNDRAKQQDLENMRKQLDMDKMKTLASATSGQDIPAEQVVVTLFKTGGILLIPIILSILWGIFYYPIACAVAGYTRSFAATINPAVGLDTIKRLGFDYVKILGMTLLMVVICVSILFILKLIFSPFNLPGMGNLPATAIGSWFNYYFSVVFAVMLGYAMYKNMEKMSLFRR